MIKMPTRIVIYAKDIITITGKSASTARRMMTAIRKKSGKPDHSFVTLFDFCEFTGLDVDNVTAFLR